tara:strand:+ start:1919 stop:2905 length:987 start_codon:yes stop_codon:yes gene_type:complete
MTIKKTGGIFGRNPTFNDVTVDGTLTASAVGLDGAVTINESGAAVNFRVEGDNDTHLIFADGANDRVGIGTDDTALFNTTGGNAKLVVTGNSSSTSISGNTNAALVIANADGTANNTAGLHFAREDGDGAPNYAGASIVAQFPLAQVNGQYPQGEMAFFTSTSQNSAPSEKMRILAGGGITFNGDTAAANALDDYEEGTFTPVFADASSSGNEASAGSAYGYYTKIGRQVHIVFELANINTSGLTAGNDIFITGLPFAPASLTGDIRHSGTFTMTQVTVVGSDIINVAEIRDNLNYLKFRQSTSGDFLTVGEVTSGTADFYVSLTYIG